MPRNHQRLATIAVALLVVGTATGCLGKDSDSDSGGDRNKDAKEFTLTIAANAIRGGKNAAGAEWVHNWVIPKFTEAQKAKGRTVTVNFQESGSDDKEYKQKVALDLRSSKGADVMAIDGIWVGEFADAGYLKALDEMIGSESGSWEGWSQIPEPVQGNMSYNGKRYGVPSGTDGRVIYFNKKLLTQAGLPADWQPKSWDEILQAAQTLKTKLPGVIPMQLNAGPIMTEATTMQGVLPLLVGAGQEIWSNGKWQGDTQAVRDMLGFYERVFRGGFADPKLQQETNGRDNSFKQFSQSKIAMLLESDYLWRSIVEPTKGKFGMADRDQTVGWSLIPAMKPGSGIRGQDFVSMSGGSGNVLNPNSKYPHQAWELLQFMNSAEATKARLGDIAQVTQRKDVNTEVLKTDPMLSFIAEKTLPITAFRPGLAEYNQVSTALQDATIAVVTGRSAKDAAAAYQTKLEQIVGKDKIASG